MALPLTSVAASAHPAPSAGLSIARRRCHPPLGRAGVPDEPADVVHGVDAAEGVGAGPGQVPAGRCPSPPPVRPARGGGPGHVDEGVARLDRGDTRRRRRRRRALRRDAGPRPGPRARGPRPQPEAQMTGGAQGPPRCAWTPPLRGEARVRIARRPPRPPPPPTAPGPAGQGDIRPATTPARVGTRVPGPIGTAPEGAAARSSLAPRFGGRLPAPVRRGRCRRPGDREQGRPRCPGTTTRARDVDSAPARQDAVGAWPVQAGRRGAQRLGPVPSSSATTALPPASAPWSRRPCSLPLARHLSSSSGRRAWPSSWWRCPPCRPSPST